MTELDGPTPSEQYAFERGYQRALEVMRKDQQRDFKFSTVQEASKPRPTPTKEPQLTDEELEFATAITTLLKSGYGKEAEIVLKSKKREWRGLTDDEIMDFCAAQWASHPIEVARIIEAKLKEKNG
jgi:hypothetical protein